MSFKEWKEVKLSEISIGNKGNYGIGASAVDYDENLYTYLRITDITDDGRLNKEGLKSVADEEAKNYLLSENDIVFARTGNSTGRSYFYEPKDGELVYAGFLIKFKLDETKVNPRYVKLYTMTNEYKNWIESISTGSTRKNINAKMYGDMDIKLPSREEQDYIVNLIEPLNNKIEVNNKINQRLEQTAQSIFKHWFVDFEFPNEEGKPYKSSGGEMVESELGMIPKGWEVKELGDIIEIFDSKRIPLSKNKREKMEKIYPYYGAASLMDYVEDYIFDGIYLLMGEDGTVIDVNGCPILQYVWGKFWVNNHAHVLKGKGNISEEFIYMLLKKQNITSSVTGAVQLKINQQNLKNIKVILPMEEELIYKYSEVIKYSFSKIRNNCDEIERLSKLRDTLLPKLMSGEIRVSIDSN